MNEHEDLLAECDHLGIQLLPAGENLDIDAPENALTPELIERLRLHKPAILATLRPTPHQKATTGISEHNTCPRCKSNRYRDVWIHDGQSIRRDCARCGKFLSFHVWYGQACNPQTSSST